MGKVDSNYLLNLVNEFKLQKKEFFLVLAFVFFLILLGIVLSFVFNLNKIPVCGDGTLFGECSVNKPYFCFNGILVENVSKCGCPKVLEKIEEECVSRFQTNSSNLNLKYFLRGEEKEINFTIYWGMMDYFDDLRKARFNEGGDGLSREKLQLEKINESEQRELLVPLVVKIQNLAKEKVEQARIAVSLVQEIAYGSSNDYFLFRNEKINYSKYPYEMLFDTKGICEEKSMLLAFLLKELGYETILFYYPFENHEGVGVRCPDKYSFNNTGYCFIETTAPSIISDYNVYYFEGNLSSHPEIIFVSYGDFFDKGLYEYKDASDLYKINQIREKGKKLTIMQYFKLNKLREKYNLIV